MNKRLHTIGYIYSIDFTWRGNRMFSDFYYAQGTFIKKDRIEKDLQKIYPNAILLSYRRTNQQPQGPLIIMQEHAPYRDFVNKYSNRTKEK